MGAPTTPPETTEEVLIHGASGGVGTFALQLARSFGATVTAVCSTRNVELARSLGASHVVDYTREEFSQGGRRYDLILVVNGDRPLAAYCRALRPGGRCGVAGAVDRPGYHRAAPARPAEPAGSGVRERAP